MNKLVCDVCGGAIRMQPGGQLGICSCCGLEYTVERMQEIYSGMKVSVTGSDEDVKQWKILMHKYIQNCDYQAALPVVQKILEAVPEDEETNKIYDSLQELQYFDIRNGVLAKYNGRERIVKIPEGVKEIGVDAFNGSSIEDLYLPDTLEKIDKFAFGYNDEVSRPDFREVRFESDLRKINFGKGLKYIESYAFCGCRKLTELVLPESIQTLEYKALPLDVIRLVMPLRYNGSVECILGCEKIKELEASRDFIENVKKISWKDLKRRNDYFWVSPWWIEYQKEVKKEEFISLGRCQYCGGTFKGIFNKVCSSCGKPKDY